MLKEIESGKLPVVLNSPTPFALEFGTNGCSECSRLSSTVEQVADTLKSIVEVYYVDVDKVPEIKDEFQVEKLPTIILFKDGKPQDTLVGYHQEREIHDFLNQ
ncbi:thioredoxin family protein [Desulfitobacterium metallireducens]|uniref:Thioredoxin n=1 Tax=Desulfitobacterium metallireducens DSM 15288 TaxID=871968 RepID=W0E873_9FIRM|nr:thioredoxin family protein [Desulfitobacterium metallireducens]AHF06972.1 thioredoxin [Desulfitobacterium metallireducens DSM 15288]